MTDATCSILDCNGVACNGRGWCPKHYQRWRTHGDPMFVLFHRATGTPEERFWQHVDRDGPIPVSRPALGPCFRWTGATSSGYGSFLIAHGKTALAHRFAWTLAGLTIDAGLQLDHLCHDPAVCTPGVKCPHRSCVRVEHLEPVTNRENVIRGGALSGDNARKTECKWGHPLSGSNLRVHADGERECLICRSRRAAEREQRRRLRH